MLHCTRIGPDANSSAAFDLVQYWIVLYQMSLSWSGNQSCCYFIQKFLLAFSFSFEFYNYLQMRNDPSILLWVACRIVLYSLLLHIFFSAKADDTSRKTVRLAVSLIIPGCFHSISQGPTDHSVPRFGIFRSVAARYRWYSRELNGFFL